MTKQEYSQRQIGLTFDFLRDVVKNPSLLDKLPNKATLEFVEKDFSKIEKINTTNERRNNKYLRVKNSFELI